MFQEDRIASHIQVTRFLNIWANLTLTLGLRQCREKKNMRSVIWVFSINVTFCIKLELDKHPHGLAKH